jgi:hypothetical protein
MGQFRFGITPVHSIDTIMLSIYNSLVHGISPEQLGHKKIERGIENWEMT